MKKIRFVPAVAAIALLASAGTAAASTTVTKGVFSPNHRGTAASTAMASTTCNVKNRACASPASLRAKASTPRAVASSVGPITKGRFQATFVDDQLATADTSDNPADPEIL